jgi:predicted DCC family thiol-disulfide oxidoreductase YuxK
MAATLLYDADCGFCARAAGWAPRWGINAAVVAQQAADLAAMGVDEVRATREIPFRDASGAVTYGAAAIAGALATGGRPARTLAWLLRTRPGAQLGAAVYRRVAANRHKLPGASDACALP